MYTYQTFYSDSSAGYLQAPGSIISLSEAWEELRERLKSTPSTLGSIILCPSTDRSFLAVLQYSFQFLLLGVGLFWLFCCGSLYEFYFQMTAKLELFCFREVVNIQIFIVLSLCLVYKIVSFTAGKVSIFSLFYSQKLTFYSIA